MKERPILFSGEMVRAILEGRKTQTRRVIKPQPTFERGAWSVPGFFCNTEQGFKESLLRSEFQCPHGAPGDRLYIKEKWATSPCLDKCNAADIERRTLDANYSEPWAPLYYFADDTFDNWDKTTWGNYIGRHRHARFMPRWASRVTLEITGVRVERVQDISEQDAKAEGATPDHFENAFFQTGPSGKTNPFIRGFWRLWDSINGKDETKSWDANPWVWVISFNKLEEGK